MLGLLQPNFRRILPENLRLIGQVLFELFNFEYSYWTKNNLNNVLHQLNNLVEFTPHRRC